MNKKSNIEILLAIYGVLGSYWLVLMASCEKFRTFKFFHCFWLEIPGGPKKVSIFDPYYNGIRVKY
jgi:hypothetical protein